MAVARAIGFLDHAGAQAARLFGQIWRLAFRIAGGLCSSARTYQACRARSKPRREENCGSFPRLMIASQGESFSPPSGSDHRGDGQGFAPSQISAEHLIRDAVIPAIGIKRFKLAMFFAPFCCQRRIARADAAGAFNLGEACWTGAEDAHNRNTVISPNMAVAGVEEGRGRWRAAGERCGDAGHRMLSVG